MTSPGWRSVSSVDPAARFSAEVRAVTPSLELLATVIAGCDHPVDPDDVERRLDVIADGFGGSGPRELCAHLFGDLGLRGNSDDYYDPDNSFIDRVLSRRLGIPISLAVVAIAVGRRVGIPLVGVGMPGHFLLRDAGDVGAFFDPFVGGLPMSVEDCGRRFEGLHGSHAGFDVSMLEVTPTLAIVDRMLANLQNIALQRVDRRSLVWVLGLRCELPGADPSLVRQLAGVLASVGRWWEAAAAHERLAELLPSSAEQHLVESRRLRAHAN
jgi:regulator of sirC expression with transglutaminase-like and TPR domain